MVEISSSGSGGGSGWATAPGYPIPRPRNPRAATRLAWQARISRKARLLPEFGLRARDAGLHALIAGR
jgi:hypothetical protein